MARFDEDLNVQGNIACSALVVGSASITNAMLATPSSGGNYIDPAKLKPRVPAGTAQVDGTVSTGEARIFSAIEAGSLAQINISLDTVSTSSDTVVIDVMKSTAGGAYASILSATYTMNSSKTARTVYNPTIGTAAYAADDIFKVTWTVTGTSAADMCITVYADMNPS